MAFPRIQKPLTFSAVSFNSTLAIFMFLEFKLLNA